MSAEIAAHSRFQPIKRRTVMGRLNFFTTRDFLRRFLQHILPKGLPRIRYFGWLANRRRGRLLPLCRTLLQQDPNPPVIPENPYVPHCPRCHGEMRIIERLTASQLWKVLHGMVYALDTS